MDRSTGFIYRNDGDMRSHEFFLYSLVRGIKPSRVLEIGVRSGVSTLALTQAISDGKIECDYHVCDLDASCLCLTPSLPININFHIESSDDLAIKWKEPLDLLLIDGCHEYSQVLRDFTNYVSFVRENGFILFHDTYPPTEEDKNPNACWDAYRILDTLRDIQKKSDLLEYVTLPYSYGLTIVRIKGRDK